MTPEEVNYFYLIFLIMMLNLIIKAQNLKIRGRNSFIKSCIQQFYGFSANLSTSFIGSEGQIFGGIFANKLKKNKVFLLINIINAEAVASFLR